MLIIKAETAETALITAETVTAEVIVTAVKAKIVNVTGDKDIGIGTMQ